MPQGPREIEALTGLRGIAAFWVVLFHLNSDLVALDPVIAGIVRIAAPAGYLGVDLFFILSGFVISYNYADRLRAFEARAYGRFLWARLARIYPVHLFTLAILVGFFAAAGDTIRLPSEQPERYTLERLLENLALVHGWALPIEKSWNVPSWSISTEWLAYVLFPLICAAALAVRRRSVIILICGLLFALNATAFATLGYSGTAPYGLVRIGVDFTVGCLLYGLHRQNAFRDMRHGLALATAYMCAVVGGLIALDISILAAAWAPPLLAMLVYKLSSDRGGLCRWLARPSIMYWGRVSYSLYMTHFVAIMILHSYVPAAELATYGFGARAVIVAALVATMLGFAVLTYHAVEQPSRRWMLRQLSPAADPRGSHAAARSSP